MIGIAKERLMVFGAVFTLFLGCQSPTDLADRFQAGDSPKRIGQELATFVRSRSERSWDQLLVAARDIPLAKESRMVHLFMRFDEARLRRDLPNTMALLGRSSEEADKENIRRANEALQSLNGYSSEESFLQLMRGLILQTFDDSFPVSACELLWHTRPKDYMALKGEVQQMGNAPLLRIMDSVPETRFRY